MDGFSNCCLLYWLSGNKSAFIPICTLLSEQLGVSVSWAFQGSCTLKSVCFIFHFLWSKFVAIWPFPSQFPLSVLVDFVFSIPLLSLNGVLERVSENMFNAPCLTKNPFLLLLFYFLKLLFFSNFKNEYFLFFKKVNKCVFQVKRNPHPTNPDMTMIPSLVYKFSEFLCIYKNTKIYFSNMAYHLHTAF